LAVPCLSWRHQLRTGLVYGQRLEKVRLDRRLAVREIPRRRTCRCGGAQKLFCLPPDCASAILSSPITRHERHLKQKEGAVNVNMKLEVVIVPVSDVDRAKAFYEKAGLRLDIDIANEDFRGIQFTPPRSEASIIFGKGITSEKPGSAELVLVVDDLDAARNDLIGRGVDVSEVFHYAGGPFNNTIENPRVAGRDPEGRSYFSFASFEDPDGNRWLLQEITMRLPGREWK
jgi:catechol 2,3-dioxygenase-like lactoylglutathione lyase family enzyme